MSSTSTAPTTVPKYFSGEIKNPSPQHLVFAYEHMDDILDVLDYWFRWPLGNQHARAYRAKIGLDDLIARRYEHSDFPMAHQAGGIAMLIRKCRLLPSEELLCMMAAGTPGAAESLVAACEMNNRQQPGV